jgi:hypothetical protein
LVQFGPGTLLHIREVPMLLIAPLAASHGVLADHSRADTAQESHR